MAFSYALRKTATVWNMSGSCRPAGLGGKEIDHSSMAGTFDFFIALWLERHDVAWGVKGGCRVATTPGLSMRPIVGTCDDDG